MYLWPRVIFKKYIVFVFGSQNKRSESFLCDNRIYLVTIDIENLKEISLAE